MCESRVNFTVLSLFLTSRVKGILYLKEVDLKPPMKSCNYFTFKFDVITCPKCSWTGQGKDLKYGEFFEGSYIAEFLCPKCITEVAFVQFPMIEEVKKWEAENPSKKTGWEEKD